MTRLVAASPWVFFDVLATGAACGARVAMRLREELPDATIHSNPSVEPSPDPLRPHLLHCRACQPGMLADATRRALEAALERLDLAESSVRVSFREPVGADAQAA